jgi:hypothetical protein
MRLPGIEPGTLAWEASILPLYYKRKNLNVLIINDDSQINFFLKFH